MQSCLSVPVTATAPLKEHPAIFMVEPGRTGYNFQPTHYVDISDYHDKKAQLLLNHKSQEEAMQQATNAGLRELSLKVASYYGLQVGCRYAERFTPMPGRFTIKPYSILP